LGKCVTGNDVTRKSSAAISNKSPRYNGSMFFRRQRSTAPTFQQRLANLGQSGFTVTPAADGTVLVTRGDCAIRLRDNAGAVQHIDRAGILVGGEIATLVDGGFQKFFRPPSGKNKPALAFELKALHDFQEDLKQALGLEILYNEALGTVSTYYLYDRVKDRDQGVPKRVWEQ
jgi:hypothetical protein